MKKALWLLLVAGAANAQTFQARDFNSDGAVDAFYDTTQNLTWLADANYYATQGNPLVVNGWGQTMLPGQMTYVGALSWIDTLSVYGVDDWRLPQRFLPHGGADPILCSETTCHPRLEVPSELSFLATALAGTSGPFLNVQEGAYMSAAADGGTGMYVMELRDMQTNANFYTDETSWAYGYVWAVRDGDVANVAAVPEPGTYALMLAGLLAVGARVSRKHRQTL